MNFEKYPKPLVIYNENIMQTQSFFVSAHLFINQINNSNTNFPTWVSKGNEGPRPGFYPTWMTADFCSLKMYAGNAMSYDSPRPHSTARGQASLRIIHFLFEILMCSLKGKGSAGCLLSVAFLHASMTLLRFIFIYVAVSVGESAMQVLLETREGLGSHGAGGKRQL